MKAKIQKKLRDTTTIVDPQSLFPYEPNPRRGDVGAISESLVENGQYKPLTVNVRQKNRPTVLAGNHTLRAILELGWTEVAVSYVSVDEETARRIVIADNRTADRATTDTAELSFLLAELADSERGLAGTGFDGDDLDTLLSDLAGHQPSNFPDVDLDPETENVCPSCGYEF